MLKLFLFILAFATVGAIVQSPETGATFEVRHYRIYASIFTWFACFLSVLFLIKLVFLPFKFVGMLAKKSQQKKENKRKTFIETVFQALINQNVENFERLSKESKKILNEEDPLYWEIQTLLFPTKENYQHLANFPQTVLGGIRGLFRYADSEGDYQKMCQLLNTLPKDQLNTPWAKQAFFQMAVQENDWEKALVKLKEMKSLLNKQDFKERQASLLFLLGKTKEAYNLDSENPAIAIGWAKQNPKKALKFLQKVWTLFPNWEIYLTLKNLNTALPPKKQVNAIKDLIKNNRHNKLSLLAMADIYLSIKEPVQAKTELDEYLTTYPLTRTVAQMMAKVERDAWHHEDQAKNWEEKGNKIENEEVWTCTECGNKTSSWHGCCPTCHTFNSLR